MTQDIGKIATALSLLASVIKSGEPWTAECENAVSEALEVLKRIGEQGR